MLSRYKHFIQTISLLFLSILLLAACNFPTRQPSQPTDPTVLPVFQTAQAAANATLTQQALILPPSMTTSPNLTETPTLEAFTQVIPTSNKPMVSVSKITNCRLGPDVSFELLGALSPGVMAEVVGVDTSRQYYYIRNPQNPQNFCWLWGYYATTVGDITSLPFFTPMPTLTLTIAPTLVSNFSVVLTNLDSCGANYYIQLKIHNIGSTVWSSGSILAKDTVTSTVAAELSSNIFQERSGCSAVGDIQNDLAPGESGALHSSDFNYNPTGHELLLTINLCTQDALSGTCQTKQINFTP